MCAATAENFALRIDAGEGGDVSPRAQTQVVHVRRRVPSPDSQPARPLPGRSRFHLRPRFT